MRITLRLWPGPGSPPVPPAGHVTIFTEAGQFKTIDEFGAVQTMTGLSAVVDDTTPALGGDLDGNGFDVTDLGTINGVDVEVHAARHAGGGADPLPAATGSASGAMSAADKTKLDGIAAGATATPLADGAPPDIAGVGAVGVSAEAAREDHTHGHGAQAGGALHAAATTGAAGFMSAADKTKLDGIAAGATATPLADSPPPAVAGVGEVGVSAEAAREDHTHGHGAQAGGALHAAATTGAAGFMSAADKSKLDSLSPGGFDPSTTMQIYDDFVSGNEDTDEIGELGWRNDFTGTGNNATRLNGEAGRPGIFRLVPGTTDAARQCIHLGDSGLAPILKGGGAIIFEASVRLTLATLSLHEMTVLGLGDVTAVVGDQTNGIYFQILGGGTPDATWFIVCASGGVRTRVNTGVAYSSGTWVRFRFTVNSAGSSVQANINGVDVGTAVTTNIPVVALAPLFKIDGIVGGATANFDIDYFLLRQTLSTAR